MLDSRYIVRYTPSDIDGCGSGIIGYSDIVVVWDRAGVCDCRVGASGPNALDGLGVGGSIPRPVKRGGTPPPKRNIPWPFP
jgi:hypothetical protein